MSRTKVGIRVRVIIQNSVMGRANILTRVRIRVRVRIRIRVRVTSWLDFGLNS